MLCKFHVYDTNMHMKTSKKERVTTEAVDIEVDGNEKHFYLCGHPYLVTIDE